MWGLTEQKEKRKEGEGGRNRKNEKIMQRRKEGRKEGRVGERVA